MSSDLLQTIVGYINYSILFLFCRLGRTHKRLMDCLVLEGMCTVRSFAQK